MAGEYPVPLEKLIVSLAQLPGIGRRTAERLATALLDWTPQECTDLGELLRNLHTSIHPCKQCGYLAEEELCAICRNPRRDTALLCIVESARQVPVIEKCGRFQGLYHVLGGRLSPLEGIEPEALNIAQLYKRLDTLQVEEIILCTSPDVEGEATAAYLAEELQQRFQIKITRIARGIPVGSDLSYADAATMAMAIDSRRGL